MEAGDWTIVVDVGKTLSKATLWNESGLCVERRSRPNIRQMWQGYAALDAAGIELWLKGVLAHFATRGPVGTIVPVAHGAAAALIRGGRLQCPPMDYEWTGSDAARASYDAQRDAFAVSGSPALPAGLNLGRQLN